MTLTKNGVCYDLEKSPYFSHSGGAVFFFSSERHKEKFDREVSKRADWMSDSMGRRFKMPFDAGEIAAMQLYGQVEGRGFYVKMKDGRICKTLSDCYAYIDVR